VIEDGTYDVFIVDAAPLEPAAAAPGWHLELTILAGSHKGDVITVKAERLEGSEFDLIGMPGTLVVTDGEPAFSIDR
jgi:hypothetical protein